MGEVYDGCFSMVDIVSRRRRSEMMAGIGAKSTNPELIVRRFLHANGLRYSLHVSRLPGSPDIVLRRHNVAILVHGCFWHRHIGCRYAATPATRKAFWIAKLEANRVRDLRVQNDLLLAGWRVGVVWECALKKAKEECLLELLEFIRSGTKFREFYWDQEFKVE